MSEEKQCEFNKNGSCLFYDVMISTIENCIKKLAKMNMFRAVNVNEVRNAVIQDLKSLLERG